MSRELISSVKVTLSKQFCDKFRLDGERLRKFNQGVRIAVVNDEITLQGDYKELRSLHEELLALEPENYVVLQKRQKLDADESHYHIPSILTDTDKTFQLLSSRRAGHLTNPVEETRVRNRTTDLQINRFRDNTSRIERTLLHDEEEISSTNSSGVPVSTFKIINNDDNDNGIVMEFQRPTFHSNHRSEADEDKHPAENLETGSENGNSCDSSVMAFRGLRTDDDDKSFSIISDSEMMQPEAEGSHYSTISNSSFTMEPNVSYKSDETIHKMDKESIDHQPWEYVASNYKGESDLTDGNESFSSINVKKGQRISNEATRPIISKFRNFKGTTS